VYKRILRFAVLLSVAFVVTAFGITALVSCQVETPAVGVKTGDWVKYSITRSGSSNIAWSGIAYPGAAWIEVEVLTVSDVAVTVRETTHNTDGPEDVKNYSLDLESWSNGYIIPSNLELGSKVGDFAIWKNETDKLERVDLTITDVENKSYGGVTRELNVMKFHWISPWFTDVASFTWEKYWDKQTGFLLEEKATGYILGYPEFGYNETNPESICIVEIADTNMWAMETGGAFLRQALVAAVPAGVITAAVVIFEVKNGRKKKSPTYGKQDLST
jgi:hypothetical protein